MSHHSFKQNGNNHSDHSSGIKFDTADFKPTDEYFCPAHPKTGRIAETPDKFINHIRKCKAIGVKKLYCCKYKLTHMYLSEEDRDKHHLKCYLRKIENPPSNNQDSFIIPKKERSKAREEKTKQTNNWWGIHGEKYEKEKNLLKKHQNEIKNATLQKEANKILQKIIHKFCESKWQAKLKQDTVKFTNSLIHINFEFENEITSITVANNIDFSPFELVEKNISISSRLHVDNAILSPIIKNLFAYRQNIIATGIWVEESSLTKRDYHKSLETLLPPHLVGIVDDKRPDMLIVFCYLTKYFKGYLHTGSIGIMYYRDEEAAQPGTIISSKLLKLKKDKEGPEDAYEDDTELSNLGMAISMAQTELDSLKSKIKDEKDICEMRKKTHSQLFNEIAELQKGSDMKNIELQDSMEEKKLSELKGKINELKIKKENLELNFAEDIDRLEAEFTEQWMKNYEDFQRRKDEIHDQRIKLKKNKENFKKKAKKLKQTANERNLYFESLKQDNARVSSQAKKAKDDYYSEVKKQGSCETRSPDSINDRINCQEFYCLFCGELLCQVVYLPCSHFVSCEYCYLSNEFCSYCILCNTYIENIIVVNNPDSNKS